MQSERLICILVIIIISLLSTEVQPCLINENMRGFASSHTIGKGTIIDFDCRWSRKKKEIETIPSIKMDSSIEDDDGEILHIVVPGGVLPEEGIALIVSGQDQFRLGEYVTVFSRGNSNYSVKKSYSNYPLEGKVTDNLTMGFTHYCYNDDTLTLACGLDVCELGVSWPKESIPVTYFIHSSFSHHQIDAIEAVMKTWNSISTMFKGIYDSITELNEVAPDGINVIRFADEGEIPDYQLACCHIWTDLEGKNKHNKISY